MVSYKHQPLDEVWRWKSVWDLEDTVELCNLAPPRVDGRKQAGSEVEAPAFLCYSISHNVIMSASKIEFVAIMGSSPFLCLYF